jgi:transposase
MIVTSKIAKIDTTNKMTVAFDVSKRKLNYYAEITGKVSGTSCKEIKEMRDEICNDTISIAATIRDLAVLAAEHGFSGLHIVSEPTGSYGDALMRMAREIGHTTAYISGESVHKAKVIENNDASKSDIKDPRIMFMLSKMGKELTYRTLPPLYRRLRELNRMYDEADKRRTEARCKIHHILVRLFCDYPLSKDFIYTHSGRVVMNHFGFNPYRIAACRYEDFARIIRAEAPGVREKTLQTMYRHAGYSSLHVVSEEEHSAIQRHLEYVVEDYLKAEHRKETVRALIEEVYPELWNSGELMPQADGSVLTPFHICRILGETGPLRDFPHWRVLFKYAGANLRVRESGCFKGQLKFSKKGRNDLRGTVGKLVFRLVRRHEIYGPYFHRKKELCPAMPGTKIMANVERKLLRMFYALGKRREAFCRERFSRCESQYRLAA